jgi:hypothetical protein
MKGKKRLKDYTIDVFYYTVSDHSTSCYTNDVLYNCKIVKVKKKKKC